MPQGHRMFPKLDLSGPERLLPPHELRVLLYRRAKGVRAKTLATEFGLTDQQVHGLVGHHRKRVIKYRKYLAYFEVKRTLRGVG